MRNPCKNNKLIEGCTKLFTANTHNQRERDEQQQERVSADAFSMHFFPCIALQM